MNTIEIKVLTPEGLEISNIECDRRNVLLTFTRKNGFKKTYTGNDFYGCFGALRADFPDFKFLCKGSKLNVHPSSMSSQMSRGLVAYELHTGKPAEEQNIVRIFDYEDTNLTNDISAQKAFYLSWIRSVGVL